MFKVIAYPSELIFNLLIIKKRDLLEVENEVYHVVAWLCLIIFYYLPSQKCAVGEDEKGKFLRPL
jgi:hypothetical protein